MAVIEIKCLQCGKSFKVKGEFAGKKGKCPVCGKVISIPDPSKKNEDAFGVNTDMADSDIKAVARQVAMGPGQREVKKRGFFARFFGRK
jgi:DNA-directed RNA polymerase subunit RPC12/RpoP